MKWVGLREGRNWRTGSKDFILTRTCLTTATWFWDCSLTTRSSRPDIVPRVRDVNFHSIFTWLFIDLRLTTQMCLMWRNVPCQTFKFVLKKYFYLLEWHRTDSYSIWIVSDHLVTDSHTHKIHVGSLRKLHKELRKVIRSTSAEIPVQRPKIFLRVIYSRWCHIT